MDMEPEEFVEQMLKACANDPSLDDWREGCLSTSQLAGLSRQKVDGELIACYLLHISSCRYCNQRFWKVRAQSPKILDHLIMVLEDGPDCKDQHIDADNLARYALKRLMMQTRQKIGRHVLTCSRCERRLADKHRLIAESVQGGIPVELVMAHIQPEPDA